jgi:methylated-DNA-protein-cysteine methyltransferase-like protein
VFADIYRIVRGVPHGRVISYGEVARLAGLRNGARTVGWAMAWLPHDRAAPWWRVIRADGTLAPRPGAVEQRRRLQVEGVRISARGVIDFARYGWPPADAAPPADGAPAAGRRARTRRRR